MGRRHQRNRGDVMVARAQGSRARVGVFSAGYRGGVCMMIVTLERNRQEHTSPPGDAQWLLLISFFLVMKRAMTTYSFFSAAFSRHGNRTKSATMPFCEPEVVLRMSRPKPPDWG